MGWNLFAYVETGLSVGVIAGILSGVIQLLNTCFPLLACYFMLAYVQKRDYTAATWTTIGSIVQTSGWPTLLSQIPGNFHWTRWPMIQREIDPQIFFFSVILPICSFIFLLASFLTPQALDIYLTPASHVSVVGFTHVADTSYYGLGSMAPPTEKFGRFCGWTDPLACPGHASDDPSMMNSTFPENITALFTAGVQGTTIASPFDINYRHWYLRNFSGGDDGALKAVGDFLPMTSLLLADSYLLVEGLIVDAQNGGIGFRNHTMPRKMKLGAQWTEDILWVEPVTACSDTNLSFHYQINADSVTSRINGYLQDDGGFANLAPEEVQPSWSGEDDAGWKDVGPRPDLAHMAYHTAWWNNQLAAQVLQINQSTRGQKYAQQSRFTTSMHSIASIGLSLIDGKYLDDISLEKSPLTASFSKLGAQCTGYYDSDYLTDAKAMVMCGNLWSAAQPDSGFFRQDLSSKWTQKIYTCASASKASVKTVTFQYNGTTDLTALRVVDVQPAATPATFAVEKRSARYRIQDIDLLFGVVEPSTPESEDVSVYTGDIFLPASTRQRNMAIRQVDTNAAARAFNDVWNAVYTATASSADVGIRGIPNYGGGDDFALTAKWRALSQNATGTARMLNLLWTNLAAATVSGSNTGFSTPGQKSSSSSNASSYHSAATLGNRSVHRIVAWPAYKNWAYGIPFALGVLVFLLCGLFPSLVLLLCCIVRPGTIVHYVRQTLAPRIVTQLLKPDEAHSSQSMTQWVHAVGDTMFYVDRPVGKYKSVEKDGVGLQRLTSGDRRREALSY